MFEGLAGSIIWVLANFLYVDLKRKGKPGLSRIILFWMGIPLTWLWFFIIPEGSAPELEDVPDDADALLAEIRRERRLSSEASREDRTGSASLTPPAEPGEEEDKGPSPEGMGPDRSPTS
jgi:hypothetical protein